MMKKKEDLSTKFLQSLVDQDSKRTITLLQNASDREIQKLFEAMVTCTRMIAGYANKRGVPLDGIEGAIVVEVPPEPGEN